MTDPLRFSITDVDLLERPVSLRVPFRFGAATVREAPQAFARVRIATPGGRSAEGWSAALMIPKWFDKRSDRSHAQNVADLRASLAVAAAAYTSDAAPATAFGHASRHYAALLAAGGRAGRNALTACYGGALLDRAVIDALCRLARTSFAAAVRANLVGLDAALTPDLAAFDLPGFLAALPGREAMPARHTIGLVDPLTRADPQPDVHDDLPVTLEDAIARYGHRAFKVKLAGEPLGDLARLHAVAAVLDGLDDYRVTLDGNEQFASVESAQHLWRAVRADPALARFRAAVRYLEQPLPRDLTLGTDVHALACDVPLLVDEADATLDAFVHAHGRGYAGVSSKSCKGVYKSLLNAARVARQRAAGEQAFLSGEDLTCQAGLDVQQDLALVALLGLPDVERNGHHYVDGFAGEAAPRRERDAFLAAHPGLYRADGDNVRLAIASGLVDVRSLDCIGFASAAVPAVESLAPLACPSDQPVSTLPAGA